MKSGLYAEIGGRERRAGRLSAGVYRLYDGAPETVTGVQIDRLWLYRSYACVDGVRVQMESEDTDGCCVGTTDERVAAALGLSACDRSEYRGRLPVGSYTVETEKEEIAAL